MEGRFLLLAVAAATLLFAGGATAGQKGHWPYPIGLTVSGQTSVKPNVAIHRYVLVRNNTTHVFRRLRLLFTPRSVIVNSSKRFKTIKLQVYAPQASARWSFRNLRLRPKTTMRIPVTLVFPAAAADGTSNLGIILDGQELAKEGAVSSGSVVMHITPTG